MFHVRITFFKSGIAVVFKECSSLAEIVMFTEPPNSDYEFMEPLPSPSPSESTHHSPPAIRSDASPSISTASLNTSTSSRVEDTERRQLPPSFVARPLPDLPRHCSVFKKERPTVAIRRQKSTEETNEEEEEDESGEGGYYEEMGNLSKYHSSSRPSPVPHPSPSLKSYSSCSDLVGDLKSSLRDTTSQFNYISMRPSNIHTSMSVFASSTVERTPRPVKSSLSTSLTGIGRIAASSSMACLTDKFDVKDYGSKSKAPPIPQKPSKMSILERFLKRNQPKMRTATDAKVIYANQTAAVASVTGDEVTPPSTKTPAERTKSSGEIGVKKHREATKVLLKYQTHSVDTDHYQKMNTSDYSQRQFNYDNNRLTNTFKPVPIPIQNGRATLRLIKTSSLDPSNMGRTMEIGCRPTEVDVLPKSSNTAVVQPNRTEHTSPVRLSRQDQVSLVQPHRTDQMSSFPSQRPDQLPSPDGGLGQDDYDIVSPRSTSSRELLGDTGSLLTASPAPLVATTTTTVMSGEWSCVSELPSDAQSLTVDELSQCMQLLNLQQYVKLFREQQIDGALLLSLDSDVLIEDFGFKRFDAIKLVKFAREGWRPKVEKESV